MCILLCYPLVYNSIFINTHNGPFYILLYNYHMSDIVYKRDISARTPSAWYHARTFSPSRMIAHVQTAAYI